jgi:lipopolysaccharide export system protein LptC
MGVSSRNRAVIISRSNLFRILTTDSLIWKASERLVQTTDPFKLLGSEIYLEGRGLTANIDLHEIVVNNNVKAVLQE